MDYKDATALDILDAVEKQFLIGEENKPVVKRDEKGRFAAGAVIRGMKRGFRWMKGSYMGDVQTEKVGEDFQTTYARACLVGAVRLIDPKSREPYRTDGNGIFWTGPGDARRKKARTPGEEALSLILEEVRSRDTEYTSIPDFNDHPKTQFSDILDVIRKAKERYWRQ